MKIGEHRAGALELKTRTNEQIGIASLAEEHALHRAYAGGPGAKDPLGCLDLGRIFFANVKSLGMKLLVANRLKCSESDVQRYIRDLGAGSTAGIQDFRRKVQSRGGRRDGTGFAGKHGLVSRVIVLRIRPLDIRRQW